MYVTENIETHYEYTETRQDTPPCAQLKLGKELFFTHLEH